MPAANASEGSLMIYYRCHACGDLRPRPRAGSATWVRDLPGICPESCLEICLEILPTRLAEKGWPKVFGRLDNRLIVWLKTDYRPWIKRDGYHGSVRIDTKRAPSSHADRYAILCCTDTSSAMVQASRIGSLCLLHKT